MNRSSLISILVVAVMFMMATSCSRPEIYHEKFGLTQGTTYSIVYQIKKSGSDKVIDQEIENKLIEIDHSLSTYNKSSLITAINNNERVPVDSMIADVFRVSQKVYEMTDGLFDITVGPLVKAWGFGPDALKNFDVAKVDSLLTFVGFDKVKLVNGMIEKEDERLWIDVNAVAQGYSVDLICRILDEYKIGNYLVEIGGEVRAKGKRNGRLWRIGLDKPVDNNNSPGEDIFAIIELENLSLATSGNYRKFYLDSTGVKYIHTINPKTGVPARNSLLSSTITAPDCATADAFATACMVAGVEGAIEIISRYEFLEGYLIYSGDQGEYLFWASEGIKKRIRGE